MKARLERNLPRRRLLTAAAMVAVVGMAAGALAGVVEAQAPATPVPSRFGLPPVHVGDRGSYNVTMLDRTTRIPKEITVEREAARFEWVASEEILDGDGAPRRANQLKQSVLGFHSAGEDGLLGPQPESLDDFDPGAVLSLDAETGRVLAVGHRFGESGSETSTSFVPSDSSTQRLPLCGLVNPLQGQDHAMDSEITLFRNCVSPFEYVQDARFKAAAQERIGDRSCIVFARTGWLGWVSPSEPEAYVWMCDDVPYPARMVLEDPNGPGRFVVFRLAHWTRGSEPLAVQPSRTLAPAPPLEWSSRSSTILNESGVVHPFPLSEAYDYAQRGPGAAALHTFLAQHPAAYLAHAEYLETSYLDGRQRYWWMVFGDAQGHIAVGVVKTIDANGATYRYENQTQAGASRFTASSFVPQGQLPTHTPTVSSLLALWKAYDGGNGSNGDAGWSFTLEPQQPACANPGLGQPCTVTLALRPGRNVLRSDTLSFPADGTADDYSLVTIFANPADESSRTVAFAKSTPLPAWNAASEHQESSTLTLALDVGPWRFPSEGSLAGVSVLAVLVGAAYWAWPAVKTTAGLGLFSRVARHRALEHPSRSELAALIEQNPGTHFQEIRRRLEWGPGMTRHHLRILVLLGLVVERKTAGYTCYFPVGPIDRRLIAAAPVLKADGARRVLAYVLAHADASGAEVARGTNLDPATVHYHTTRLVDAGILELRQDGRLIRARPLPVADPVLLATM